MLDVAGRLIGRECGSVEAHGFAQPVGGEQRRVRIFVDDFDAGGHTRRRYEDRVARVQEQA
jgi:hypothetical protein